MSAPRLNLAAEQLLLRLHLQPEKEDKVRRTILRYVMPDDYCERFDWAVNLTRNAFCSVLEQSDWEVARRALQHRCVEIAIEQGLVSHKYDLSSRIFYASAAYAEKVLSACLELHRMNPESLDLDTFVGTLKAPIEEQIRAYERAEEESDDKRFAELSAIFPGKVIWSGDLIKRQLVEKPKSE